MIIHTEPVPEKPRAGRGRQGQGGGRLGPLADATADDAASEPPTGRSASSSTTTTTPTEDATTVEPTRRRSRARKLAAAHPPVCAGIGASITVASGRHRSDVREPGTVARGSNGRVATEEALRSVDATGPCRGCRGTAGRSVGSRHAVDGAAPGASRPRRRASTRQRGRAVALEVERVSADRAITAATTGRRSSRTRRRRPTRSAPRAGDRPVGLAAGVRPRRARFARARDGPHRRRHGPVPRCRRPAYAGTTVGILRDAARLRRRVDRSLPTAASPSPTA